MLPQMLVVCYLKLRLYATKGSKVLTLDSFGYIFVLKFNHLTLILDIFKVIIKVTSNSR